MKPGDLNLYGSQQVMRALVGAGVRHLVISPGSRSTPLVLAAMQYEGLQLHVVPDERSAAFFALGISKTDTAPAAVLATSGSAPAHWYPAVIEAASAHWPLILLSADRPPELHACGANQTIDQTQLFGKFTRGFFALDFHIDDKRTGDSTASISAQAVDLSRWPVPGPVHINLSFREPLLPESGLSPAADTVPVQVDYPQCTPTSTQVQQLAEQLSGKPGIIVAGTTPFSQSEAQALHALTVKLGCPLFADTLSGLRFDAADSTQLVCRYDTFLRDPGFTAAHAPEWLLQLGAAPVSRTLQQYIDHPAKTCQRIRVSPVGDWPDPARNSQWIVHADVLPLLDALREHPLRPAPTDWYSAFRTAEQQVDALLGQSSSPPLEATVLTRLLQQIPANSAVFASNSMVIRDCDSFIGRQEKPLSLNANRGASGIDGNVSTLAGMAAAHEHTVVGILGDLALYHDMNGLLALRDIKAVLVVFSNGGGAIFSYLPQSELPQFKRYWLTDTTLDMASVAQLYRLLFRKVETADDFEQAFSEALAAPRSSLIEVVSDREDSVARHRAFWSHFKPPTS